MTTGDQGQTEIVEVGEAERRAFQSPDAFARFAYVDPEMSDDDVPSSTFDVTTMLELSLFLMLLTFFLVLTANTSFDDRRVGSVIGGVQSAFGALTGGELDSGGARNGAALPVLQTGALPASGAFASEVATVFAAIGASGSQVDDLSLNMVLQAEQLFVPGSAAIKADQRGLFAKVGLILQIEETARHIAVLVPSSPDQRLDVRRAATLARLLLQDGAPATQIAVGVKQGGGEIVTFRFYTLPGANE